jgi:alpha-galactosidase
MLRLTNSIRGLLSGPILHLAAGAACVCLFGGMPRLSASGAAILPSTSMPEILAPPDQPAPRINGPSVFGVRPGSPFFYAIPATGERPMDFGVEGLPAGLSVDAVTGVIRGVLVDAGEHPVELRARNKHGTATKRFAIKCGEEICLTPPMGWNSWNCWGQSVSQEKVIRAARAMASSGLARHGWTYVNIDDGWQGARGGPQHALQGNDKFPDLKALSDEVHALGLKIGLYSTPWVTSYAGYCGGSSDNPDGVWTRRENEREDWRHGRFSFATADARQWAAWGVDYLKYDWAPIDVPHAEMMFKALRGSGRDIVLSLSNSADVGLASEWPKVANCWRTTGDIGDQWQYQQGSHDVWRHSVSEIAFSQDPWTASAGPGHWNDPDMLVIGRVGWGPTLHATQLTPSEQISHITMWCMLSAPLLLGCDLEQLDAFTMSLLTNDEVLAIDQDALGKQAKRVATVGPIDVYLKQLEDGSRALAFFNRSADTEKFIFNKLNSIGLGGARHVRDVWRQRDLPDCNGEFSAEVSGHGVFLLRLSQ